MTCSGGVREGVGAQGGGRVRRLYRGWEILLWFFYLTFPMTCLRSCWDRVLKLELGSLAGAGVWVHGLRSQRQRRRWREDSSGGVEGEQGGGTA